MSELEPEELEKPSSPEIWKTMSCSVKGARHVHNGTLCQDAVLVQKFEDMFVLSVADGHGDPKHAHSDKGSQFAVETACKIVREALQSIDDEKTGQECQDILRSSIAGRIAWEWNARCKQEHLQNPSADGEWSEEIVLYGTTLLVIGFSETWLIVYQLGDGDILFMDKENQPHFPFPEESISGIFTDSLCQKNHLEKAQIYCQKYTGNITRILLSTDGIRDCLAGSREKLIQFANWLEQKISREGSQETQEAMKSWLSELSLRGNGDDNSFALLWSEKE